MTIAASHCHCYMVTHHLIINIIINIIIMIIMIT